MRLYLSCRWIIGCPPSSPVGCLLIIEPIHHDSEREAFSHFSLNHGFRHFPQLCGTDCKLLCWFFRHKFPELTLGNHLNRCSHLRRNNEYLSYVLTHPSTKFLALRNLDCLCDAVLILKYVVATDR